MLKCHYESTVSRAYLLQRSCPEIRVFGGIVLNQYVGGINPVAVETALRMGAKEVWMPTVDAHNHALAHGGQGKYDLQAVEPTEVPRQPIRILQDDQLIPEVITVLDLIVKHKAILGTSHIGRDELGLLVPTARERGVNKILITHPFFKVPRLDLSFLEEMVSLGAIAEFGYCTVSPMWAYASFTEVAQAIKALGAEHCILVSDGGQPHNPMPCECLRIFAQSLHEKGITRGELDLMLISNPRRLLGLD
jgi:hypothetical protein